MLAQLHHHLSIDIGQGWFKLQKILEPRPIAGLDQVGDAGEEAVQSGRGHVGGRVWVGWGLANVVRHGLAFDEAINECRA